jgi:hypothetical protein
MKGLTVDDRCTEGSKPSRIAALHSCRLLLGGKAVAHLGTAFDEEANTHIRCTAIDGTLVVLGNRDLFPDSFDDVPAQALLHQPGTCASLLLIGWLTLVDEADERSLTDRFAQQHPTGDLLDLGHSRSLYRLEVVESHYRDESGCCSFDASASNALLSIS